MYRYFKLRSFFILALIAIMIKANAEPANDNKANAIELTHSNYWCSALATYNNYGATVDGSTPGCGGMYSNVWFKFQATTSEIRLDINTGGGQVLQYASVALLNSSDEVVSCASSQQDTGDVSLTAINLTIGEWYYIAVYNGQNSPSYQGAFSVCIGNGKMPDNFADAIELAQQSYWCKNPAMFTNVEATADGGPSSATGGGMHNNVWFKFQATTTYIKVAVETEDVDGALRYPGISLRNANDEELPNANQISYGYIDVYAHYANLTIGEWYYVSVFNWLGSQEYEGAFSICATNLKMPDNFADAVELKQKNNWCSSDAEYTNVGATDDALATNCGNQTGSVWYKFQAATSYIKIDLNTGGTKGTIANAAIALRNLNVELSCMQTINPTGGGSIERRDLTIGEWYYISVYNGWQGIGQGTFSLCVNDQAPYEYKEGALLLSEKNNWCSPQAAYTLDSKYEQLSTDCGYQFYDVWFKFQASTKYFSLKLLSGGAEGNLWSPAITLWNSDDTVVACALGNGYQEDNYLQREDLVVGSWYFVSVATPSGIPGTFSLCVNDQPELQLFDIGGGGTYCPSGSGLNVTLSGSSSGITYQLKANGSDVGQPKAGTEQSLLWSGLTQPGTYTIQAIDNTYGWTQTMNGNVEIMAGALPTQYQVGGGGSFCTSGSGVTITLNASQVGVNYQMKINSVLSGVIVAGTGNLISWTGQQTAGTYTVTAVNATTGCSSQMTSSASIVINPLPSVYTLAGGGHFCTGSVVPDIILSSSQSGVNYQLRLNGVGVGEPMAGTGNSLQWKNQTAGSSYTVVATNTTTGCVNGMNGSTSLMEDPIPTKFNVTGGGSICAGDPGLTIILNGSQSVTNYQLIRNGINIGSPITGNGSSLSWPAQTQSGTYTVSAVSANNCVVVMNASAQIVVNTLPSPFTVSGGGAICEVGTGGTVTLSGSQSGISYQLLVNGNNSGAPKTGSTNSINWTEITTPGVYSVRAVNQATSCQSIMSGTATITITPLPQIFSVISGNSTVCLNSDFSISLTGSETGVMYQLQLNDVNLQNPIAGTGSSLNWTSKAQPGTYKVMATRLTCTKTMQGTIVPNILALPQLHTLTGGGSIYVGGPTIKFTLHGSQTGVNYFLQKNGSDVSPVKAGTGKELYWNDQLIPGAYKVKAVNATTGCTTQMTGQAFITDQRIPQEVKITREGILPAPPIERQYGLGSIQQGDNMDVFLAPPCLDGRYYVGLQLYYDLGDSQTTQEWTSQLSVTVMHGEDSVLTLPLQVDTKEQTFISTAFYDSLISCGDDYRIAIKEKKNIGNVPEGNIYLKLLLYEKDALAFDPSIGLLLDCSSNGNETTLAWNYPDLTVSEYDIEWVFIATDEKFTGSTAQDAFLFKEPVRITTAGKTYKHINYYPAGTLWYRARAVGYNPLYPDHRIQGIWSYSPCSAIQVDNPEQDMNWQEQTVFAEDGKYKKVIRYYDGSMRERQVQTNLNTENVTLTGETLYDYEGRPSLQILPVPAVDNSLKYKSNFNQFTTSDPLIASNTSDGRSKFHYDNRRRENSVLSDQSGAAKYYSVNNATNTIHKEYIPQSNGYAYTQTEYTNDGSGRVSRQSGVGAMFRQDGDHTTRTFYGTVAPSELIPLFGSNAGNATHYKKTMVVDPNNQVSVTYHDQEGRTIATALAGDKPSNVDALDSYEMLDSTPITVDISNRNIKENGTWTVNHTILNEAPNTPYTFNYNLAALASQVETMGCQGCSFDLEIVLTNPDGVPLNLSDVPGNQSTDTLRFIRKGISAASCADSVKVNDINFTLYLADVGDYTLTKTLSARELSFEEMQLIVAQNETVQQQINQIKDSYTSDPSQCAICTELCPEAEQAILQAIEEVADQDCENVLNQIIAELKAPYEESNPEYEPTSTQVQNHPSYCQYVLCMTDKGSDVFDRQLTRYKGWSEVVTAGYSDVINLDPFFNDAALSGSGAKGNMQSKLNDVFVGNVGYDNNADGELDGTTSYHGPIEEVTDPANTDFYIDNNGNPNTTGFHLLYATIMSQRSALGETEYQRQIDEQRWTLFRNFYSEAKRRTKLELVAYNGCTALKAQLSIQDELPKSPGAIEEWSAQQDPKLVEQVSTAQLQISLASIMSICNTSFNGTDSTGIVNHLENYFNSNKKNFFRLILKGDLAQQNPDLTAIENILNTHSCSLDSLAVDDPLVCVQDTTITIPAQLISQSPPQNNLQATMTSLSLSGNQVIDQTGANKNAIEELKAEMKAKSLINGSNNSGNKSALLKTQSANQTLLASRIPPQSEYDALVDFYNSTGGPNWNNTINNIKPWNAVSGPAQDVSNWYGIGMEWDGHVAAIDLSENQLSGSIPSTLGNLSLRTLDLSYNQLQGAIPSTIGTMSSLQFLALANNKLSGDIPATFSSLVDLRTLWLSDNQLTGRLAPECVITSNTDYLWIENNKFTFSDIIEAMGHFGTDIGWAYYAPQDSVDVEKKIIPFIAGQAITLVANVDRNTIYPSKFQWFKYVDGVNDLALNSESVTGHTFTIASPTTNDLGRYYYRITNDNEKVSDLTLISHVQTIQWAQPKTYSICLGYDLNNPTLQKFTYTVDWNEQVLQCMEREAAADSILTNIAVEKLVEQHVSSFYTKYTTQCLQRVTEKLTYTFTSKEYHYTLYYFDQGANLVQTVPPNGVHPLTSTQVTEFLQGNKSEPAHTLVTRYAYNSLNQLTAQHTPDAGATKFLYDDKGQLRLSQNAQQLIDQRYSYTRYDEQGRIVEVGETAIALPITDNILLDSIQSIRFPNANDYVLTDVTRTHYDFADEQLNEGFVQNYLRSRVAWTEVIDQDTVKTHYSYDIHGNVKSLRQSLPGLSPKQTDYVYDLVSGKVNYVMYQYGKPDQFIHQYDYDADNRIRSVHTSSDGFLWNKEAAYDYYLHGPLARTELGQYRVQGLDYFYTLQGWIKGVNLPYAGDPGADGVSGNKTGKDVFAYALGYFNGDYTPINNAVILSDNRDQLWNRAQESIQHSGLYNGNISWMVTDLSAIAPAKADRTKGMQAMLYRYDQLHRITKGRSLTTYVPLSEGEGQGEAGFTARGSNSAYDENYSYDGNGNILTLKRNDELAALKDDFVYAYYAGTNKLKNVKTTQAQNYSYDAIGNLVNDAEEGVTISWTPYGKVRNVQKGDSVATSYRYDASGNRVEKRIRSLSSGEGWGEVITRYLRDASGNIMTIYKDTISSEIPIYGSSRLGQYKGGVMEGHRTLGHRNYELSNHLGNVLSVVTDNAGMKPDSVWATVVSTSDYYPFGLEMKGRSYSDTTAYRYGFNGKEKDNFNATVYDYGFRIYNPEIGKFLSVDPLTKSYPWYTPYQFAGNKPIWAIDLDGLEELIQPFENRDFQPVMKAATKTDAIENALNNALILFPKAGIEVANEGIGLINWSYGVIKGTTPNITGSEVMAHIEGSVKKEANRVSKMSGGEVLGELKETATDWNTYKNAAKLYFLTKLPTSKSGISPILRTSNNVGSYVSPSLEELTELAVNQYANKSPLDLIGNASVYGSKGLTGSTFVYEIALVEGKDANMFKILTEVTNQAKALGAESVEIKGHSVINKNLNKFFKSAKDNAGKSLGWEVTGGAEKGSNVTLRKKL